jgi:hypothetical protein
METEKSNPAPLRARLSLKPLLIPDISLVVQFLLGMFINLYVKLPGRESSPAASWKAALHSFSLVAHMTLGVIILVSTFITLAQEIKRKNRHMVIVNSIGAAAMTLSVLGGLTFVTTRVELASYLMAVGFLTGILVLNVGYLTQ